MKQIKTFCDRCGNQIVCGRDDVTDFLESEYPGKDICEHCDLLIYLATQLTAVDIRDNQKFGTALQEMLDQYHK